MTPDDVQSGLQSVFNTVFRRTDIMVSADLTAADVPGWDSFRYVSLIMATEERFDIHFSDDELEDLRNVGDLLAAVTLKVQAKG